jgi:hypothetical protein
LFSPETMFGEFIRESAAAAIKTFLFPVVALTFYPAMV